MPIIPLPYPNNLGKFRTSTSLHLASGQIFASRQTTVCLALRSWKLVLTHLYLPGLGLKPRSDLLPSWTWLNQKDSICTGWWPPVLPPYCFLVSHFSSCWQGNTCSYEIWEQTLSPNCCVWSVLFLMVHFQPPLLN